MQGEVAIKKYISWDRFHCASQGNPSKGGSRGILYLCLDHNIFLKLELVKKLQLC